MNGSGSTDEAERQIRERIQGELGRQFLQRNNERKMFVASNEFLARYRLFVRGRNICLETINANNIF